MIHQPLTHTDINILTDKERFYCSTRGVIKQNEKYLVMSVTNPDNTKSSFHFPGGHIEIGENAEQALKREILEEVKCEVNNIKMFAFLENFWEHNGKINHGLELFFLVNPSCQLETKDYTIIENDKGKLKKLEFKWLASEELKTFDVRPQIIKDLILNNDTNKLHHLVQRA